MSKEIREGLTGLSFEKGYEILRRRGTAIVGLSPGNSYFKRETIDELLNKSSELFSSVKVMIADKPTEHTFRAIGYDESKAVRKARLSCNTLRNHAKKSIDSITGNNPQADVEIVDWSSVEEYVPYVEEYNRLRGLYDSEASFREAVRETTRKVLNPKLKPGVDIKEAVDEGIHYLLKELAYLTIAPCLYDTDSLAYVYHNRWGIYEDYVSGKFDGQEKKDLGYVILH